MLLSPYPTAAERIRVGALWACCVLVLVFLVVPIFVPVPLSFNSGSFFTFPLAGLSTRWYEVVLGTPRWRAAIGNSLLIGFGATILATVLGTLTAIGLSDPEIPGAAVRRAPADLAADRSGRCDRRRDLSLLCPRRARQHLCRHHPRPYRSGEPVRRGDRRREPHRLRPQSDAGDLDSRREAD